MKLFTLLLLFIASHVEAAPKRSVDYTYSQVAPNEDGSVTIRGLSARGPDGSEYGIDLVAVVWNGGNKRFRHDYLYTEGAFAICRQVTGLPQPFNKGSVRQFSFARYAVLDDQGRFKRLSFNEIVTAENAFTSDELSCKRK